MSAVELFSRLHSAGWLVLAPGLPTFGGLYPDLAAHLLEHIDLAGASVCICAASAELKVAGRFADELEALLDRECPVSLLGGTAGKPPESALAVLCGGEIGAWAAALAEGSPTGTWLAELAESGLVLAAGPAAAAVGAWGALLQDEALTAGADWLSQAIVLPGAEDPGEASRVRELLAGPVRAYAIGLPEGSILALGPSEQVELWGSVRPTILLGGGWRSA